MKSYEIERKYLIHTIPFDLKEYAFHDIEQGYLCTEPVVRIRKQDDTYYLTYKSKGSGVDSIGSNPQVLTCLVHHRDDVLINVNGMMDIRTGDDLLPPTRANH